MTKKRLKQNLLFNKFILPALFLYTLFFVVPLFGSLIYSLTDWDGISKTYSFIGIKNYLEIFTNDSKFLSSLTNTFKLAFLFVFSVNVFGLSIALLLDSKVLASSKRKNFYRSIIFIPNAISLIIVAFLWQFVFTKIYGEFVTKIGLKVLDISWFGNGKNALIAVLIAMVWQSIGYYMVIYIAGLQAIDNSLLEAASIDGATGWKKFINITIPYMIPVIIVNFFLSIAQAFKVFDVVFQMTGGGPNNATGVIALNIYQEAFQNQRIGYGAAKSIVLFILVVIITYTQLKFFKSKEVDQ